MMKLSKAARLAMLLTGLGSWPGAAETSQFLQRLCGACVPEKVADCAGFLEGVTFDAKGNPWAVGVLSGSIFKISDGKCEVQANTGGQPNGAKFLADGRLLIADKLRGILVMDVTSKTFTVLATGYKRENFRGVNDLALTEDGIYFTEPYGSSVLEPTGRVFHMNLGQQPKVVLLAGGIAFPNGIAVSPDGRRVYVAEYAAKRIISIPSLASTVPNDIAFVLASQLSGGVGRPDGLAVDPSGNVYAASMDAGEVAVFDSFGQSLGTIKLPAAGGKKVTNVGFSGGYIYITEGDKSQMWRVKLAPETAKVR